MKSLLVVLLSLATTQVFDAGAIGYDCVGRNRADGTGIEYNVYYQDYAPEAGYTDQSIVITKIGAVDINEGIKLQMFGATKENDCKATGQGETYFNAGKLNFEMTTPHNDDGIAYINRVKSICDNAKFDIIGVCQPQ